MTYNNIAYKYVFYKWEDVTYLYIYIVLIDVSGSILTVRA